MLNPYKNWKPKRAKVTKSTKLQGTKLKASARVFVDKNRVPIILISIRNTLTPHVSESQYHYSKALLGVIKSILPQNKTFQLNVLEPYTPEGPYKDLQKYLYVWIPLRCRLMIIEDCYCGKLLVLTVKTVDDSVGLLGVQTESSTLDREVKRLNQLENGAEWFDQFLCNEGHSGYPKHVGD